MVVINYLLVLYILKCMCNVTKMNTIFSTKNEIHVMPTTLEDKHIHVYYH